MPKRRKRKSDADVVYVLVGLGILLALAFQKQLGIILKVGLWLVLVVGIVAGVVIAGYLLQRQVKLDTAVPTTKVGVF